MRPSMFAMQLLGLCCQVTNAKPSETRACYLLQHLFWVRILVYMMVGGPSTRPGRSVASAVVTTRHFLPLGVCGGNIPHEGRDACVCFEGILLLVAKAVC